MLANSLSLHGMDDLPTPSGEGMLIYLRKKSGDYQPGIYIYDNFLWKSVNQIAVLAGDLRVLMPTGSGTEAVSITPEELAQVKHLNTMIQQAVSDRVTHAEMTQGMSTKADLDYTNLKLSDKADLTQVNQALQSKADANSTSQALAARPTTTAVNQGLAPKAEKTYVDTELEKKANVTDMNTGLGQRALKSYVDEELAKKAIAVDTTTALATKADKTTTYTKTEVQALLGLLDQTFHFPGNIIASSGPGIRWYPPVKIRLLEIQGWVGTAPAVLLGGTLTIDVLKNGVSILSTAERPTLTAGATATQKITLATAIILETTDYLSIKVVQGAGMDGTLRITYKPA